MELGKAGRESEEYLGTGSGSSRGALWATSWPPGSGLPAQEPVPICALHLCAPGCLRSRTPPGWAPRIRAGCVCVGRAQSLGNPALGGEASKPLKTETRLGRRCLSARRSPAPWRAERAGGGEMGVCFPTRLLSPRPSPKPWAHPRPSISVPSLHCGEWTETLRGCGQRPPGAPRVGASRGSQPRDAPPGLGARARRGGAGSGGGDLTPPPLPPPQRSPPLPPARTPVPPRPRPPPPTQHRQASQTRSGGGSEAGVRGGWAGSLSGGRSAGKAGRPALGTRPRLRRPRSLVPGPWS